MIRKKELFSFLFLSLSVFGQDLYVQEISDDYSDLNQILKPLSLNIAIEQGMRKNFSENIRKNDKEIYLNKIQDNKEKFYYPNINLTLDASSQRVGTVKGSNSTTDSKSKIPTGSFGLEFGEYSIFNWGKDYLSYLNTKEELERSKDRTNEESREFRQDIIIAFTNLIYLDQTVRIKKEQLRTASFIYRLNRERVIQKKVSKHEYYQARSEYLRAQQEYFETKLTYENAHEEMAKLIDDEPGTKYQIAQNFRHQKVKLTLRGALELAAKNAPFIKDGVTNENIKKREYEIAIKDNMPLPKITLDLGTYKHHFSPEGTRTLYEVDEGNSNLEVVATVKASWTIFGDGGVFNRRKLANARLSKENSTWNARSAKRKVEAYITKIFQEFSNSHDKIKILEARVPSLKKTMELANNRYIEGKGRYTDFHISLVEYFDAQIDYEKLKWEYLRNKILLAQLVGLEDLPGESFDNIIVKNEDAK
ncbi:TolC family protein [Bacteriovorax sp. Seq25_V]|uniref:TolC family protein n=1 Tax=Bacteriovorax sp. Seq25_V TaxID=1201288 RepID=UPI00038A1627|nr:TolC family protein [Bacteriovorax sp. Seq25_V]EQC46508.1 outer membrane efflux protein [Bacteriovorax sp. Seq25_V]